MAASFFTLAAAASIAIAAWPALFPAPVAAAGDERVIVIGSDGADYALVKKYMEAGELPNLARLAEEGSFRPLATSNPAQSPVSWATFNTGSNPGKTRIFDFLKRKLPDPGALTFAMAEPEVVRTFEAENVKSLVTKVTVGFGAGLVVLFVVLAFVLRASFFVAGAAKLALAALGAGAGYVGASKLLPIEVTRPKNNIGGTTWVKVMSEGGVAAKALQLACSFPPEPNHGTKVLAGLGVPDLAASWGTWFYFSTRGEAGETQMGGRGLSIECGQADTDLALVLLGPESPVLRDRIRKLKRESNATNDVRILADIETRVADLLEEEVAPLYEAIEASALTLPAAQSLKTELSRSERFIKNATSIGADSPSFPKRLFPFTVKLDRAANAATFALGGRTQTLREGEWSDFFEPEFRFGTIMAVTGTCRVFLLECGEDVRFLVTPINFHPGKLPITIDLSHPRSFAAGLSADHGCFETLGWAEMTNPLKDQRLTDQGFLDHLEIVERPRREMIEKELEKDDWRVFFGMLSGTDRVQHMMFRYIDPEHPLYPKDDPELAARFGGSVLAEYKKLDDLVGKILDRHCRDGKTTLLVVSDHGFGSFRRGVNLNSWLALEGYQKGDKVTGRTLADIKAGDVFRTTDWSQTKAYSYTLGKICINLRNREKDGIVEEKDFDALCDEIIAKLKALEDPDFPGRPVVKDVYKAKDIYDGPYWKESEDLVVGFAEGYRIDWDCCLGGRTEKVFIDNDSTWSGDHCSIDPSLVPGILFSNRKVAETEPRIIDLAPTLVSLVGLEAPAEWDGRPLTLEK